MSIENVQAFIDASKRPENKDAYAAALSASDGSDEAIVAYGNRLGFEFDLSDLETFMASKVEKITSRLDDGELTEDELGLVAGGNACTINICDFMSWLPCC